MGDTATVGLRSALDELDAEHRALLLGVLDGLTEFEDATVSQLSCAVRVHNWAVGEGLIHLDEDPGSSHDPVEEIAATFEEIVRLVESCEGEPDSEEIVGRLLAWLDAGCVDPAAFPETLRDHLSLLRMTSR